MARQPAGRDLGRDDSRGATIVPGNVETSRQALWYMPAEEAEIVAAQCPGQRYQPGEVAAPALFRASDEGRMGSGHEHFVAAGWR